MARTIVICGFHANEDAGIRICKEWTAKKKGNVYTELSELAGRKITDKEVELLDVSKHTHHALVKDFTENWPLERLIALYGGYSEQLPEGYKKPIKEYLALWKQYKRYFPLWRWQKENAESHEAFKELKEKCDKLLKDTGKRFDRRHGTKDILFPKELHDFTHQPSNDARELVAKLKKEGLAGAVAIDLHSTPTNRPVTRGKPYSYCHIYIAKQKTHGPWHKKLLAWYKQEKRTEEIVKRLNRHCAGAEESLSETEEYPFSYICIELYHKMTEEKNTAEFYRWFYKYPSFQFMLWLTSLFTWKETFEPSIAICTDRLGFCDPAYYDSKEYGAAKRFIANVIRETLEWSEKYQNNAK